MHRVLAAMAALVVLTGAAAAEPRTSDLSGFTAVDAARGVAVVVRQGEDFAITIDGSEAGQVRLAVTGETLHVRRNSGWFQFDNHGLDATVHVTMPRISRLSASQGASIEATGVRAGGIAMSASQGGQLNAHGACGRLRASASMGGVLGADTLNCRAVEANASMGGIAAVRAIESIEAHASMGGQISVAGGPEHTELHTSMGGGVSIE